MTNFYSTTNALNAPAYNITAPAPQTVPTPEATGETTQQPSTNPYAASQARRQRANLFGPQQAEASNVEAKTDEIAQRNNIQPSPQETETIAQLLNSHAQVTSPTTLPFDSFSNSALATLSSSEQLVSDPGMKIKGLAKAELERREVAQADVDEKFEPEDFQLPPIVLPQTDPLPERPFWDPYRP